MYTNRSDQPYRRVADHWKELDTDFAITMGNILFFISYFVIAKMERDSSPNESPYDYNFNNQAFGQALNLKKFGT